MKMIAVRVSIFYVNHVLSRVLGAPKSDSFLSAVEAVHCLCRL